MNYNEIAKECKELNYREKLNLSVQLIQMARKEEEALNPRSRTIAAHTQTPENAKDSADILTYVIEHLPKNPPTTKKALLHAITTIFQFRGGISGKDAEEVISGLEKTRYLKIVDNGRVEYRKG